MLGAYAMDRLTPPQRAEVNRHLKSCAGCRAALAEIAPVAQLLPNADPRRIIQSSVASAPRPEVATKLFTEVAEQRRRLRMRTFATTGIAGVAAAVMVAVLVVPTVVSDSPSGQEVAFVGVPASVKAESRIVDKPWGSEIHLNVAGLSGRQTVWFEERDGSRASAGSFEAGNGQPVELVLSTAFKSVEAVALCVSPPNAPAVLRAPLNL